MCMYKNVYIQLCILYSMNESVILEKKTHSPNLDTIEMIEKTIEKNHDFKNITELYHALPRGVQYGTFKTVLDYLERSNKISYDKNGAVFWIFSRSKPGASLLEKGSVRLK